MRGRRLKTLHAKKTQKNLRHMPETVPGGASLRPLVSSPLNCSHAGNFDTRKPFAQTLAPGTPKTPKRVNRIRQVEAAKPQNTRLPHAFTPKLPTLGLGFRLKGLGFR